TARASANSSGYLAMPACEAWSASRPRWRNFSFAITAWAPMAGAKSAVKRCGHDHDLDFGSAPPPGTPCATTGFGVHRNAGDAAALPAARPGGLAAVGVAAVT